jgi:glycosyltransferase involved in cell wall biosynthesis
MKTRVLMLGPGEGIVGGIAALIDAFVPFLEQRVDLLYLPTIRQRPLKDSGKVSLRNVIGTVSQYTRFLWALLRFRPQIIHLHTSQGIAWFKDTFYVLVSKAVGCRVVLHMHGGNFHELYEKNPPLIKAYTRYVLRRTDAVVAVSPEWKTHLARFVSADQIIVLQNCIKVDAFVPSFGRSRGQSLSATNGVHALFLGAVGPSKGTFDLLEAMGHLKSSGRSLHVWVAGYEERKGDLERARARLEELRVQDMCELVGTVRGEQKARLFREASLFVLPSYFECLPMALLEAMAAGLPIVATAVGGIPTVVQDGYNGFLISPGDVEALAEKLSILVDDPHLREQMGRQSRKMAEQKLDVEPYVNNLVILYDSLKNLGR